MNKTEDRAKEIRERAELPTVGSVPLKMYAHPDGRPAHVYLLANYGGEGTLGDHKFTVMTGSASLYVRFEGGATFVIEAADMIRAAAETAKHTEKAES